MQRRRMAFICALGLALLFSLSASAAELPSDAYQNADQDVLGTFDALTWNQPQPCLSPTHNQFVKRSPCALERSTLKRLSIVISLLCLPLLKRRWAHVCARVSFISCVVSFFDHPCLAPPARP